MEIEIRRETHILCGAQVDQTIGVGVGIKTIDRVAPGGSKVIGIFGNLLATQRNC